MNITELPIGTGLTITAKANGQSVDFKSSMVQVYGGTILIDEIRNSDDEAVSFLSDNVYIEMVAVIDGRSPIIWRSIMIKHILLDKIAYCRVAQSSDGKVINRRTSFRLYAGRSAMLQKGLNSKAIEVILKDISTSGFSFVTSEDIDISGLQIVHLVCDWDGYSINTNGSIVRRQDIGDTGKYVYGCKVIKFDKTLDKFIIKKQREILQGKRGKAIRQIK